MPPAEEGYGFAVYGLRNSHTRTSELMRGPMNGLYVYSIVVGGSLLALVICSVLLAQQNRPPALAAIPSENRVFLDTPQHSGQQPPQPALPYAAPESDVLDNEPPMPQMSDTPGGPGSYGPWSQDQTAAAGLDFNLPGPGGGTPATTAAWMAVYDISAHTVYLPDGTKLEAHSGLGRRLDDPRYVHEHMRGATPPNVYELALREKTFHGVQALRLKPVGGGNTFGRKGLLAHTYMLGPKGESNGCLVFKNYNAFLQAFQNGQVKRLIVVDNLKVGKGYELTSAQVFFPPIVHVSYWNDANATAQHGQNLVDAIFQEPLEVPAPPPRPADVNTGRLRLKERGMAALMSAPLSRRETHHGRGRSAKIARLIDRRVHASAHKTARHRHWHDVPVGILREAARHRHWHDVPVGILREAHR
jgi:Protein of unknown function (DUF2778)